MIFLFDKFKKLKGTVRNRHTISLLYERERNGLYTVSAEIPLKITDKKTVYNYHKKVKDSDFLGHYDREGRFQLHKIASVDIEGSSIYIKGVHLFFDEAKAGAIIQERRFRDREIIDGARVAFDSIGWSVVDFDVSDTKDYIFYNVSPLEARAILVETFGFEFDYWLDFDGKNIRNKQISVKREMGKDSNKRYNYGHNVLNIKVEQDYSEIYTAVIGRGKGEDLGDDAYGRRIEYTDVEWKTPNNPMDKPKGSRTLHDENATQLFGYHEDDKVSPRTKVEIFEDIEEPEELLQASYVWLRENSVPKAVFSLKVPDGDGLDLGDKVHVIYRDIDLVKHTRVTRVVDDLVSGNRDVEFGDTAYFKTDRRLSGVKSELKRVGGSMSSRISRLKLEFDRRFDDEVQQWYDDFEQAVIDAEAAVEVMRAEMEEEFATVRSEMTDRFESERASAYEEAQRNFDAISERITTEVDSTRSDLESSIASNIAEADRIAKIEYEAIRGTITSTIDTTRTAMEKKITDSIEETERKAQLEHEEIEQRVTDNVDTTRTALEKKITDSIEEAERKAELEHGEIERRVTDTVDTTREELETNINTSIESAKKYAEQQATAKANTVKESLEDVTDGHQGMLESLQDNVMNIDDFIGDKSVKLNEQIQDVRLDFEQQINNISTWHFNILRGSRFDEPLMYILTNARGTIDTSESIPFLRTNPTSTAPYITMSEEFNLEDGKEYHFSIDYRTENIDTLNYINFISRDGSPNISLHALPDNFRELPHYNLITDGGWRRVHFKFTAPRDTFGTLRVGTQNPSGGQIDLRLPYLTETDRTQWLYHQLDNTQNLEEITRRITQLEDGREEFITINQYDFETEEIEGSIKHIIETVGESTLIMQNHENWITTNGASIERTVDGFDSKAWLTDIHNPNLLSFTEVGELSHRREWGEWKAPTRGQAYTEFARFRNTSVNYNIGAISPTLEIIEGETYTLTWVAFIYDNSLNHFDYCYIMTPDGNSTITPISNLPKRTLIPTGAGSYGGNPHYKYELTFTAPIGHKEASVMIGATAKENDVDASFAFKEPKLELGDRATPYLNAFSNLTQRADEIMLAVQGVGDRGYLSQSDISVKSDYVQIGSQRLDGSDVGSILRVSPSGIDAVAKAMRLSGDLYVDGDITTLAVNAARGDIAYLKTNILTADSINATHIESETIGASQIRANSVLINKLFANSFAAEHISTISLEAVEGEFASLFAAQVKANTIDVDYISGRTAWFERLYTLNANIEKLTSQFVFTDAINAKVGDFIELNVGTIRSSILTANSIQTSMLDANVVTSAKIRVDHALVNRIMAQSVYANDVTAKIGDFIDLNVGTIRSSILTANTIDTNMLKSNVVTAAKIKVDDVLVNLITARTVFTDAIHAKSLDAIEANIGRVRTAFLKADVISGSHIKANTVEIKHLTGYDAMLNILMARTVFSTEVKALSIDAVEANIGSLRTQILTSNVIKSTHIQSGNALIDKIFSSEAMFERMMSKSAFVRTLNTVSIDTDQLTIRRADGGVLMSNGTQRFGSPIITKPFPDTGVDFDGTNYMTTLRSVKTFERAYGEHSGRWANFSFRIGLDWTAKSNSTYMRVVVRPGTTPSGVTIEPVNESFIVYRGEQRSETINVRMPVPTFGAVSWTLEFYRVGDNIANPVTIRSERCWVSA